MKTRLGVLAAIVLVVLILVASGAAGSSFPGLTTPTDPPPASWSPAAEATTTPDPRTLKQVRVDSIAALLRTLADDSVDVVVVADGTYAVSPASDQAADSLWIGSAYARRTRPVLVRAETPGGVVLDGGGATYFGCISFQEGVHDQTWDGFTCSGGEATSTGIVTFGGYRDLDPPYRITMRHIAITRTCTGSATAKLSETKDHAFYLSDGPTDGPHDLTFEDIAVDGSGGLAGAFAFGHEWGVAPHDVVVRRLDVIRTQQAIILWSTPPIHDVTFEDVRITGALRFAVRFEDPADTGIVFRRVHSSRSGVDGFYSSLGSAPAGVSFEDSTLD